MKKTVDVSLPIGPLHPCFKEPARIRCETRGERVVSAEMDLGYVKKGIERIMRGRPWQEVMFLAERVCGICSVVHNMVCIETLEQISGIEVPDRAAYLRVIVNELDRIQSHILANFSYCYTIEHETLAMYLLNTRETAMDMLELITGARVTCAYMVPGGVRFDLRDEDKPTLEAALVHMEKELDRHVGMFKNGPLVAQRSRGVGIISREDVIEAHGVGPVARASGIPESDRRIEHPTYQKLGFSPLSYEDGDNYARVMIRFDEVYQSIDLIRRCLAAMVPGPIRGGGTIKAGEGSHAGEAPRGELIYYVKTDEYGRILDITIRTPSIMNIESCAHYMLEGVSSAADVTSTFISADPCIACTER
jgi:energy-converting hydrogenase A subunit O